MVESSAFSIENRKKILEEATGNQFDFVFTNCGFKEALFCLFASGMGYRCALFCNNDFDIELHLVVDSKDIGHKLVHSFRERFPHLILPDEYLHIYKEKNILSGWFANSIKEKDLPRYEPNVRIADGFSVGLEKEFKINSNRLLLSLIKSAVNAGACVLNHVNTSVEKENELIVTDALNTSQQNYAIRYHEIVSCKETDSENETQELHMRIDKKGLFLKRSLKFYVEGRLVRMIRYQDCFLLICKVENQGLTFIKLLLQELSAQFGNNISFDENDIISTEIIAMNCNSNLKEQLELSEKMIKQQLNVSSSQFAERLKKLPVIDTNFEGRTEIQALIEFADFKFDEAKQTGIQPIPFKNIFYRFGSETEKLTELAYEWRAKYGPGERLWQNVQLWYLYNHEMICSMDDYYSRLNVNSQLAQSNLLIDQEIMNQCLFV